MKHPVLARVMAIFLAVLCTALLLTGVKQVEKTRTQHNNDERTLNKLIDRIDRYEVLEEQLASSPSHDELKKQVEELDEKHSDADARHRTDIAVRTATRGGLIDGEKQLDSANEALKQAEKKLEDGKKELQEQKKQVEEGLAGVEQGLTARASLEEMQAAFAGYSDESPDFELTNGENIIEAYRSTLTVLGGAAAMAQQSGLPAAAMVQQMFEAAQTDAGLLGGYFQSLAEAQLAAQTAGEELAQAQQALASAQTDADSAADRVTNAQAAAASAQQAVNDAQTDDGRTQAELVLAQAQAELAAANEAKTAADSALSAAQTVAAEKMQTAGEKGIALAGLAAQYDKAFESGKYAAHAGNAKMIASMLAPVIESSLSQIPDRDTLTATKTQLDAAMKLINDGEAQLADGEKQLKDGGDKIWDGYAQIWQKLGELDDEAKELEDERDSLQQEYGELNTLREQSDEQLEREKKHKSLEIILRSTDGIKGKAISGKALAVAGREQADILKKENERIWQKRMEICVSCFAGALIGLMIIPTAYELIKNRVLLLASPVGALVCSTIAEIEYEQLELGHLYAAIFCGIFALLTLLTVLPKEKQTE